LSGEEMLCLKQNGTCLITPHHRHSHAFKGTLSARPGWGVRRAPSFDLKLRFRDGQQPMLREMILVKFWFWSFWFSGRSEITSSGGLGQWVLQFKKVEG